MAKTREEYNAYMRVYMLRRYHTQRNKIIEALGGTCAKCGSCEELEIDHIDANSKALDVGRKWSFTSAEFAKEIAKCQLLCKPCHVEKTKTDVALKMGYVIGEHGKINTYKKYNCRCVPCVNAFRDKSREYKQRYRNKQQGELAQLARA